MDGEEKDVPGVHTVSDVELHVGTGQGYIVNIDQHLFVLRHLECPCERELLAVSRHNVDVTTGVILATVVENVGAATLAGRCSVHWSGSGGDGHGLRGGHCPGCAGGAGRELTG